jgi:hypothetical protein
VVDIPSQKAYFTGNMKTNRSFEELADTIIGLDDATEECSLLLRKILTSQH